MHLFSPVHTCITKHAIPCHFQDALSFLRPDPSAFVGFFVGTSVALSVVMRVGV